MFIVGVIPCYKTPKAAIKVVNDCCKYVDLIICVDDFCPLNTGKEIEKSVKNKNVHIAYHKVNKGVGGAMKTGKMADGYGYDIRVQPRRNIMLTSSFTGWSNYMMDFGQMLQDSEAMKRVGNTMVLWDLHSRKPKKVFDVPGAPLEIRCAWGSNNNYCFTTTALTSKLLLIYEDKKGEWQAEEMQNSKYRARERQGERDREREKEKGGEREREREG